MAIENLFNEDGTLNEDTLETAINERATQIANDSITQVLNDKISQLETKITGIGNKANNDINVIKDTLRGLSVSTEKKEQSIDNFINNLKGGK